MEPFSIACTTCQARLRVRDDSVIGQILTCPKCGSMVLVEPVAAAADTARSAETSVSDQSAPAHDSTPPANLPASPADFEDAASLFDEPTAPNSPDLTETVEDLSIRAEAEPDPREDCLNSQDASGWRAEPSRADEPDDVAVSERSPPPLPPQGDVLLPNADWTSAATVKWRNRILTSIAAVVGVVLALVLLIVFSSGDQSTTIASRPTAAKTGAAGAMVPERERPQPAESNEHAEEASTDSVPDSPSAEGVSVDASSDVIARDAPDDSSNPPIESANESPAAGATSPEPVATGAETVANDPPPDAPPGLTPKEATTDTVPPGGESSPLADSLREFGPLLEKTEEPVRPAPAELTELPPAPESDRADEEPVARRTGPRVVEVADRLSDPVLGLDFDGKPLVNFLRLVSDCSTIPITLDADILRWARVSPATAVKLQASDTTVAEILKQGLAPLGLEYRIESDQLFVTRRAKDETGMRTVTFKVEDLVGDDAEQLQQLGTHVMDFAAPESWSSRGGIGTITFQGSELIIEQHETVQFEILEFCEKLRVARGLKTRSPYAPAMFRLETRRERASANLAPSVRLTYLRPAPLQRIVNRIAEASDRLHILIDWRALADAGWSPDAEVLFSVADQPVAKALTTLLEPMDLAYRVIDDATLQITTPAVVDSRLEIEFYRVPKPADNGAKLVQSARDALGREHFRDSGGDGQLVFDEPSNCLLACLSQTRQLELQAWLAAQPGAPLGAAAPEKATPTATVGSRIVPASGRASND